MALYELSWRLGNGRHPAGLAGAIMVVAVEAANQQWYAREDRRKIGLGECQKMAGAFGVHKCTVLEHVTELRHRFAASCMRTAVVRPDPIRRGQPQMGRKNIRLFSVVDR